jgi:hypothetical protein
VARFGGAHEHADWETAHHVFTYANAVHRMLKRIGAAGHRGRDDKCQENRKAAAMVLARALPLLMLGTVPEPAVYKSEQEIRARLAELGINFDDFIKLPPFDADAYGSKDPSLEPDPEREPAAKSDAKAAKSK